MVKKKKEEKEVEVPLLNKIPEASYFLVKYVANFQTGKVLFPGAGFDLDTSKAEDSEPVFVILDVLDGPEIPSGLTEGRYRVIKTVRKFVVSSHTPEAIFSTKELKL